MAPVVIGRPGIGERNPIRRDDICADRSPVQQIGGGLDDIGPAGGYSGQGKSKLPKGGPLRRGQREFDEHVRQLNGAVEASIGIGRPIVAKCHRGGHRDVGADGIPVPQIG